MTLKERNDVLRLALDNINYIVTENAGNNPTDVEKQYDCNAFAFDAICKVVADCVRAGLPGSDLPPKTYFTPEAARKFAEEQAKKAATPIDPNGPTLNQILMNPPFGRALKMPVISMPGRAAIKYQVEDPELPRLAASIETIKSDSGKVSCDCTLYAGSEALADMTVYRGKVFAVTMVRHALKGAMSKLGKHRRMTANRQSREVAKKEGC